ncbi:MAG: hypothetical protein RIQ60_2498 [Pseudomonadota bacterium]|jgi:hypothetical protein
MTSPRFSRWSRRLAAWLASGHVLLLGMSHLPLAAEGDVPPGVCSVRTMTAVEAGATAAADAADPARSGSRLPWHRLAAHGLSCPLCTGADAAPPPVLLAALNTVFLRTRLALSRESAQVLATRPARVVARGPPVRGLRVGHAWAGPKGRVQAVALPVNRHLTHIEKPLLASVAPAPLAFFTFWATTQRKKESPHRRAVRAVRGATPGGEPGAGRGRPPIDQAARRCSRACLVATSSAGRW